MIFIFLNKSLITVVETFRPKLISIELYYQKTDILG
jgi:hypothetical protein